LGCVNTPHYSRWKIIAYGVAIGIAYGLFIGAGIRFHFLSGAIGVMSVAFVVLMPLAMGYVTVFYIERHQPQHWALWIVLPWIPVVFATLATMAVLWEGMICAVMFLPLAMIISSIGGVIAGAIARSRRTRRVEDVSVACMILLPLLVGPWEQKIFNQKDVRTVESVIDIQAPPDVVWRNIERVPAITPEELEPSWSRSIGFPPPVEATLSREGIGGVRHATFGGGVLFIETIDVWEPQRQLSFSIQADQIPTTTFDEHVTVGGAFFDVLRGEYRLEQLANGTTRLHLLSRHRVSTDFNWYAHLWTDAIMADLQWTILKVVRKRCESTSKP
jgi:hypothetical protein